MIEVLWKNIIVQLHSVDYTQFACFSRKTPVWRRSCFFQKFKNLFSSQTATLAFHPVHQTCRRLILPVVTSYLGYRWRWWCSMATRCEWRHRRIRPHEFSPIWWCCRNRIGRDERKWTNRRPLKCTWREWGSKTADDCHHDENDGGDASSCADFLWPR